MAKFDYHEFSPIEIYNMVLQGNVIKRFPRGFWQDEEGMENARVIIKYLFEERLGWTDEEVLNNISARIFQTNGLWGLLSNTFKDSPVAAYNHAYPDKFKPWELSKVPRDFWNRSTAILATKWMVEEKLKLPREEIPKITSADFQRFGLSGMQMVVFQGKYREALKAAYPEIEGLPAARSIR